MNERTNERKERKNDGTNKRTNNRKKELKKRMKVRKNDRTNNRKKELMKERTNGSATECFISFLQILGLKMKVFCVACFSAGLFSDRYSAQNPHQRKNIITM